MAVVEKHGDRPAHREADHDDGPVHAEDGEESGGVVGAVLQREGGAGPQAPAVTPVIEGHHPVAAGQFAVEGEEVQVGADRPAVQKEDGRGGGAAHWPYLPVVPAGGRRRPGVPDEDLPAARQRDHLTRRQRRRERGVDRRHTEGPGQAAETAGLVAQRRAGGHGQGGGGGAGHRPTGGEHLDGPADGHAAAPR